MPRGALLLIAALAASCRHASPEPAPPPTADHAAPSRFSHKLHLDRGRMENAVGFHDACEDCHASGVDDGAHRALANHDACARCHQGRVTPAMGDCNGCHAGTAPLDRERELIHGDLTFSHAAHQVDRVGRQYSCKFCHEDVDEWRTIRDRKPPEMQRCTLCHEDKRVTPPDLRISNCAACHLSSAGWSGVLAPRSHQLGSVAPDDHTLAFRRNHADAARDAGQRCAQCHQGLSGSRRDSCAECHATMRPRDHTLTWREQDHGREAAALRGRCVQCHQADFCEACHSIPPRSHVPLVQWAQQAGHALAARIDLRSCFACHTFESSCIQCHQRGLK